MFQNARLRKRVEILTFVTTWEGDTGVINALFELGHDDEDNCRVMDDLYISIGSMNEVRYEWNGIFERDEEGRTSRSGSS